jgi:hypothetical protein
VTTLICAFIASIDVATAMSSLMSFFTNALNTPQANAPNESLLAIQAHFQCSLIPHVVDGFLVDIASLYYLIHLIDYIFMLFNEFRIR